MVKSKSIPKEFTLGSVKWSIKVEDSKLDDKECYGTSNYGTAEILLQVKTKGEDRTFDSVELTLYHEVIHSILDTLGEYELSNNEKFVTKFSALMHQFVKTKK